MAIVSYNDQGTQDIACGLNSKAARKILPPPLHMAARLDLVTLANVRSLVELNTPGYQLEALKGSRIGQYSIRINRRYRICFTWVGRNALDVQIVDYHDER